MTDFVEGSLVGQARLIAPLGRGSMGVVWKARHLALDMEVAVKVLRSFDLADAGRFRERLRREARLTARIDHPGIVRVYDLVDHPEHPSLVMELVDGPNFDSFLRSRGPIPERTSLMVAWHLSAALGAAHEAGILHRDIKPSNILVSSKGVLKISDLGLARPLSASSLTDHRNIMGTPLFMAPELFTQSSEPDVRTDLYSLGVVLYQAMAGVPPFPGTTAQVIHGHLHKPPDLSPIPPGSRDILSRLLEKDPDRRPSTASEIREMVCQRIQEIDGKSPPPTPPASTTTEVRIGGSSSRLMERLERHLETTSVSSGKRILHSSARERILVTILLSALLTLALLGWLLS
ncbi:MAG: serine/threonine protein kinase [Fibrobacteria bacterium]|nr:serine/threonine protein kinase [Fibrobacteria bacterium]